MKLSFLVLLKASTSSLYHELFGEYGVSRPDYHKVNYHQVSWLIEIFLEPGTLWKRPRRIHLTILFRTRKRTMIMTILWNTLAMKNAFNKCKTKFRIALFETLNVTQVTRIIYRCRTTPWFYLICIWLRSPWIIFVTRSAIAINL